MRTLVASFLAMAVWSTGSVAATTEKQAYCGYQGAIVAAVSQARLDRVPEGKASDHVLAQATWPEKYNVAVPIYVGEVYKLKRRDLKKVDLGKQWEQACLDN